MTEQWHSLNIDKALEQLASRRSGLAETEAKKRLDRYGYNELKAREKTRPIVVFLKQFLSPLIYVLMAAVIISLIAQHHVDALVISGVLLFNAVFGCIQELQAEKAMEALMQMAAPRTKVRRDGRVEEILAKEVVPGDILLMETGDRVSADARLLESSSLKINEAMLTADYEWDNYGTHIKVFMEKGLTAYPITGWKLEDSEKTTYGVGSIQPLETRPSWQIDNTYPYSAFSITTEDFNLSVGDLTLSYTPDGSMLGENGQAIDTAMSIVFTPANLQMPIIDPPEVEVIWNE